MARKRVVVVGAGPGGLAAALLLAQAGLEVQVVERLDRVGGRNSALEADGFRFDRGPTFFLYPRILQEIFAALGRDLFEEVAMVRLDPQYKLIFGAGGELLCTPNLLRMQSEIARLCPEDAPRLHNFMQENRAKLKGFAPILESPMEGWLDLFRWEVLRLLPMLRPWHAVDQDLRRYFSDPRVRLAFSFQSKYLGMSPFQCPSLFTILSFLEYEHGVFHPMGGCAAVCERMEQIAREMGVQFALGEEVEEVLCQGRRAHGVRTRSGSYWADALVINADFARAMTRLVPSSLRKRWSDHKIASRKFSCSTFMLYLGVQGSFPEIAHHTIYISHDYAGNLRDITRDYKLTADPSFYVQNASITDPSLAPPGHSALYCLFPVPHLHESIDWRSHKESFRKLALEQLKKIGLPDLSERIVTEQVFTPLDWEAMEVFRGATFSMAHNLGQMLHLRPHNRFEELDGVYLVGGGTHPGSGLPVIFSSARISSMLLCQDMGVKIDWAPPLGFKPRRQEVLR